MITITGCPPTTLKINPSRKLTGITELTSLNTILHNWFPADRAVEEASTLTASRNTKGSARRFSRKKEKNSMRRNTESLPMSRSNSWGRELLWIRKWSRRKLRRRCPNGRNNPCSWGQVSNRPATATTCPRRRNEGSWSKPGKPRKTVWLSAIPVAEPSTKLLPRGTSPSARPRPRRTRWEEDDPPSINKPIS